MFILVAVQVIPSLADVLNPSPQPVSSTSPAPEPTLSTQPSATPSQGSTQSAMPAPQPSGSYSYISPSDSPTAEPTLADEQDVFLRVPSTFPVDPRATSVRISPINVYATGDVLMCISTSGSHLWLSNQSETVLTKGNNSKFLVLSGKASDINILLNSGQGIRVGGSPRVQGSVIFSRAAVVTRPTLNSDLCSQAPTTSTSSVVALGLGMNTVKNPVPIK